MEIKEINLVTAHLYIGNNVPVYKDRQCTQEWTLNDYLTTIDDVVFMNDEKFYIKQTDMDEFDKQENNLDNEGTCYG